MPQTTAPRWFDDGARLCLYEHLPPPPRGQCVWVETSVDATSQPTQLTLSLRHAEYFDDGNEDVDIEPSAALLALASGVCTPVDARAEQLFAEHPWIAGALRARLEWLRERARRHHAQRDRMSCFEALAHARRGVMISYGDLFPADWDLLVEHEDQTYWAVDHHCTNEACTCEEITVALHRLDTTRARLIGDLRIDFSTKPLRPKPTNAEVLPLFEPLWTTHGAELLLRYHEVRRALRTRALATRTASNRQPAQDSPARNAPCRCGSGKKYKRCCADRDLATVRVSTAPRRAPR